MISFLNLIVHTSFIVFAIISENLLKDIIKSYLPKYNFRSKFLIL
jgi:hypothetical protein